MKKDLTKDLVAKPGKRHRVEDFDPAFTAGLTKGRAKALLVRDVEKLSALQSMLYAEDRHALLIIFQGMDAAGKDGTVKHVMSGINPQGCQVFSFKTPSPEELDHDYLWRIHRCIPERGRIGIFNRSHYEDVLIAKVHPELVLNGKLPGVDTVDAVDDEFWKRRYRQINDFERYLTENGVVILKFFLNISKDEQKKRFMERLEDKAKNWKFDEGDIKERAFWEDYMKAYSDMLTETSTEAAPWFVIPADNKWFMRYAVGRIVCDRMKTLNLHYPKLSKEKEEALEIYKEEVAKEDF